MIPKKIFVSSIYHQCGSCASNVFDKRQPTESYAKATQDLLFGTIAHESDSFTATRQHGFSWYNLRGAWGLAQCELGSVKRSLFELGKRPELAKRAAVWVNSDKDAVLDFLLDMRDEDVLRLLPLSDRLSILFCRLHYFWVPAPIPLNIEDQAFYYKKYYNTYAGAAKPSDFIKAFNSSKSLV